MILDGFSVQEEEAPPLVDEAPPDEILDREQAERWLMWLSAATSRLAELDASAARHHDRIDAWHQSSADGDRRRVIAIKELLAAYARRDREQNGVKSWHSPYGRVETRDAGDEAVWDDDALLDSAQEHCPKAVVVRKSVDKRVVKAESTRIGDVAVWRSDGAEVAGLAYRERPVQVNLTVDVSRKRA